MNLSYKIKFHFLKTIRMLWYRIRYKIYKWKNIEGIEIPVYLNYGYSVLRFMDNGAYERSEISIIKKTLLHEDRVLELGTGIGFISAFCAKQIGSEKVFTYEGNPSMQPLIQQVYTRNKVSPISTIALLGSENGSKIFYKNEQSFLASSSDIIAKENYIKMQIEERDLNEVIRDLQPTYLIMDIEGGEYDIFKIIEFQSIQKIQFELHPSILDQEKIATIFDILKNAGFIKNENIQFPNNFYFTKNISSPLGIKN